MQECIFCRIAHGELGTEYICENELAVAFADMNPQAPVHVLVVPRSHHENMLDGVDGDTLLAMNELVGEVVDAKELRASGFRLIANTGSDAGQTVNHLHWHVLGGKSLGEGLVPTSDV